MTQAAALTPPRPRLKKRLQAAFALSIGIVLVHLVGKTVRYIRHKEEALAEYRGPEKGPVLYALWHGSYFGPFYYGRHSNTCVITSRSADGEMLARALRREGFQTVRGSSSRGAVRALVDLTRRVREGVDACIAVDGPKGPPTVVKPGIVLLAKLTGRPIVPIGSSASRCWRFQSWDRFRLPLPFSRVEMIVGPAIHVPIDADDATIEARRAELEESLRKLHGDLDAKIHPKIWCFRDRKRRSSQAAPVAANPSPDRPKIPT